MIALSAIFYVQEQNEPSCPEFIMLDLLTDDPERVHDAVLKHLNDENFEGGEWVESDTSFFGDECWQFKRNSDGLHCFVNQNPVVV